MPEDKSAIREQVRETYARAARRVLESGCSASCSPSADSALDSITSNLYDEGEKNGLPSQAVAASLGCGNPTALAELRTGETVLDLGSGGGIDVLLSARRVGAEGLVYGLDMTDEMLALARRNVDASGLRNIVLLKGYVEQVPLPAETVD